MATIRRIRTPGYPITPAIFLMLVAVLLFLLAAHNPIQAAFGVGIVALGIPIYQALFRGSLAASR
ncbi:MAG: hypothetical protein ACREOG_00935 [Gemmatimonadaceae bacterium]